MYPVARLPKIEGCRWNFSARGCRVFDRGLFKSSLDLDSKSRVVVILTVALMLQCCVLSVYLFIRILWLNGAPYLRTVWRMK